LIAIALVYNPGAAFDCQPLRGTPYAVWVAYLSVISSGIIISIIIWIGIILNRAFREFIVIKFNN
jgi:hypothetical protein